MAKSNFKQLAQDLMNIEVNTIIKPEMSGTKFPSSRRQALYELAMDYDVKLKSFGVRAPEKEKFSGMASFGELRDRAEAAIVNNKKTLEGAVPDKQIDLREQIQILQRIADHSSQMVNIFKSLEIRKPLGKIPGAERKQKEREALNDISRDDMYKLPDLDLAPEEVNRIRKAWEIGTEKIMLQTVVQIDGDITTRISEGFLKAANKTLLDIHKDGVVTATGFWQELVKTLGEMAGGFFNKVLTGK